MGIFLRVKSYGIRSLVNPLSAARCPDGSDASSSSRSARFSSLLQSRDNSYDVPGGTAGTSGPHSSSIRGNPCEPYLGSACSGGCSGLCCPGDHGLGR